MKSFKTLFLVLVAQLFLVAQVVEKTDISDLDASEKTKYQEIAEQLRCPTCQNLPVLSSDAPFSLQIKNLVKEKVKEGKSEKEVVDFFTERYGAWILREPPKKGINLIAWVFPLVLLVVGPVLVWFFVWRRRKTVSSFGVRTTEALIEEFYSEVNRLGNA